jgi:aldehyde dehydrogenase (NAD+)
MSSNNLAPPPGDLAEIRRVFDLQQDARRQNGTSSLPERREKLARLRRALDEFAPEIVAAIHADFRRSPTEGMLTEIFVVTTEIEHARRRLARWMKPRSVPSRLSFFGARGKVRFEPRGVCLVLSPWNFPFQLTLSPIVSAIAAGNRVIAKPSEFTPHTSAILKKFLAGVFPEDEVAVVAGDARTAQALLDLPFDHIFFTGSTAVGRIVLTAAAKHFSSVTLELGGKCPTILDEKTDLREACRKISWGKFLNAGQTCVAPDYVLVPSRRLDEFVGEMKRSIAALYGPPERLAGNSDYGRLVDSRHFASVRRQLDDALAAGACVVAGGEQDAGERFMAPTLVTGVAKDSPLLQKEIFGPVLPILTFDALDEALSIVNSMPPPLAVYVFSRDRSFIEAVLAGVASGGAMINDVVIHFCHPDLPFGGFRESGLGMAHGHAGFMAFSRERSVLRQPKWTALSPLYPPYTATTKRLVAFAIRFLSGR